ncbi:RNA polymerase sigma-70 factor [Bacteroides faecium]|uniref:RNA polymerase sigma-70 factor n=1 Tax=Bacteroides faecium TaxID=2715212 RepID=A0A6H0KJN5_9BACE|nr:RNA polymerase sigma-70 factor [Bacteroides faecium]QIU93654.1 RNA polymerase sigma-70 factor [Bacteroides faecium]
MDDKIDTIVAGVNRKDERMWGDFYDRFYAALCVYVSKILPVPDAVEDLVQEVFISVWEGKRTFSDIKELANYLYRACYNNTLLYIRNNQIHDTILSSLAEEEGVEDEDMIYALTVKEEIIRQLYCHIEELPAEQRRIILMRIEGHTWEEIAERLEISINTVKTQKTRSYKFLRERLGDSMNSIILCLFL